jgi:hypothetical protein
VPRLAAPVLISVPNQYQGTMALSTAVAHCGDVDHRQVAFSFAIPRGPERAVASLGDASRRRDLARNL